MKLVHYHFKEIDSTNSWAKRNISLFEIDALTIVSANEQTKGKGRNLQKKWHSPSNQNIYATFCTFLKSGRKDLQTLSKAMSLPIVKTLESINFFPKIKPPNDFLLNGKKVGGILTEIISYPKKQMILIGIGLNINMKKVEFKKITQPATSLFEESKKQFDIQAILKKLKKEFTNYWEKWKKHGFTPLSSEYEKRLSTLSNRES